ncbi:MAG: penicillin-binding protein [Bacteroidetes bacterium]|nr:MAG: penicillin-binding protein [Bacteroidota bacterium]
MNHPTTQEKEVMPPPQTSQKKRNYKPVRWVFLGLVALLGLVVVGFIIYAATDIPPIDNIENPRSDLSTQVLSADGMVLQNFYSEKNRVAIQLNEMSPYLIDGLIATEDIRFYRHSGVDYNSLPAIVVRNFIRGKRSGGSTITMQLTRNLFDAIGRERTLIRKLKEIIVAAILERNFTKEEILAAYLNTVSIYGQTYGVEMAAQRLFDKPAKALTLEEAATMVAMLKGQGLYNPYRYPDTVVHRRNLVINLMAQHGLLNTQQIKLDSIKQIGLKVVRQEQDHIRGLAPYFREHVRAFADQWCDERGYNLYRDGLKIYTTIDSRMQIHAEAAVAEHLKELQKIFDQHIKGQEPYRKDTTIISDLMRQSYRYIAAKKAGKNHAQIWEEFNQPRQMTVFSWEGEIDTTFTPLDSIKYYARFLEPGMVSIDPSNGQVKAWVGGINYKFFKYDHVAKGKRQVGSTFKPFVYGAAFELGHKTPCDVELNQPVYFEDVDGEGTRWAPKNSTGKIGGLMTLRRGLATSTNIITARLMKGLQPFEVVKFAQRAGIRSELEPVYALCLGTSDLNVLELTSAYCTFVNKGQYIEPVFISRIEDKNGNVLAEFHPASYQAMDEKVAYLMVEMLKGVVDEPGGTGGRLRSRYHFSNEIGGKTGTTQNHSDGWFIGVSPHLVSGVWVGCSDRRMHFRTIDYGQGASMALPIWALYMQRLYKDPDIGIPEEATFPKPPNFNVNLDCDATGLPLDSLPRGRLAKEPQSSDDFDSFE